LFLLKNSIGKFDLLASHQRVKFVGNVCIGEKLSIDELKKHFHAIVFANGSDREKSIGIQDEFITKNVYSAREFVGWYNGDPEHCNIEPDLQCTDTAIIIGLGNVALDCARILLSSPELLKNTDITDRAFQKLKTSNIKHVHVVGRRGVIDASFTSKELRELMSLNDVCFQHDSTMLPTINSNKELISNNRQKKRLMSILQKESQNVKDGEKSLILNFLKSPKRLITERGSLCGLQVIKNQIFHVDGKSKIIPTNETKIIRGGLLIKSIGYMNSPIKGIPFDRERNLIPNIRGRVIDLKDSNILPGLYTAGWIKTGPVGVLTSTLFDAAETAQSILQDLETDHFKIEKSGLEGLLENGVLNPNYFNYSKWCKINEEEIRRGNLVGKPREKMYLEKELKKYD
jgi:adrenodoxin-NADP+ reductase